MGGGALIRASACLGRSPEGDEGGTGNCNAPDESFAILPLKLLTVWCRDVKHGKGAGDIEEQGSKGEVSAGATPIVKYAVSGNGHHRVTVSSSYLLPDPNTLTPGSSMESSSLPSFKNRSGL